MINNTNINNIFLIGMPGCGKTTLGKVVSIKLKEKFIDLDDYIEKNEGMKIKDIFEYGEYYFRTTESQYLAKLCEYKSSIISTGGGVVTRPENLSIMKKNGIIIFINRPLKDILADIDTVNRPLLRDGKDKLVKLYDERYPIYQKNCDYEIQNNGSVDDAVKEIVSIISKLRNEG